MRKSVWLCVNMSSQLSGTIDLFQQLHETCSIGRISLNEGCIYRGKYNIMYHCVLGVSFHTLLVILYSIHAFAIICRPLMQVYMYIQYV